MKANEIKSLSVAELETKLVDLKKDLFMLRMNPYGSRPALR